MGYSIMTPFEEEKQQKMLKFLAEQFKSLNDLTGEKKYVYLRGPTDDLSYDADDEEKFVIGFDYSGGDFDRAYAHRMCTWMALMDGKRKSFEGKKFPFIIYDGCEDIAVVQNKISKSIDHIIVDENGFYPLERDTTALLIESAKFSITNNIMKNELRRLTETYKALK
jgi:hypothetical protein